MANINFAIQRLLATYPLHGAIVAAWKAEPDQDIPTLCVGIKGTQARLRYNPEFIDSLETLEAVGVLVHEVNHILGGHVWFRCKDYPNEKACIIATEVTANQYVKEPLPGKPILLEDYPQLPFDEDASERYKRLELEIKIPEVKPLDMHDWEDLQENETLSKMILGSSVGSALSGLSSKAIENIPSELLKQARTLAHKAKLNKSDFNIPAKLNWQQILRRYVGSALNKEPRFTRAPRRFPELLGITPANIWCAGKPRVMVVFDTSGSIRNTTLSEICIEMEAMNKTHQVTVVECDSEIRAVYDYKPIERVKGRGATDFHPPFQAKVLHKIRPDLVVYFTDGCGKAPLKKPHMPVVWCITEGGQKPSKWGSAVYLGDGK